MPYLRSYFAFARIYTFIQIHTHLFVVYRWATIGIVCWASIGNMGGRQLEIVLNRFRKHFSQFYVYPDNNMSIGNVSGC